MVKSSLVGATRAQFFVPRVARWFRAGPADGKASPDIMTDPQQPDIDESATASANEAPRSEDVNATAATAEPKPTATKARTRTAVKNADAQDPSPETKIDANETVPATTRTRANKEPKAAPNAAAGLPGGPYAIIETGGKQYRVRVGDTVQVERLAADAGSDLTIDRVLLLVGDGSTRIGTPVVEGAAVTARVDDHFRGEKLIIFKYKAKKRYRRRTGHRQELTRLTITAIQG